MAQPRIHWLVPSLMIGGVLCGIGFALGHHFFYSSWDNHIVESTNQQQWNIRIGTGMAFLVKTFLTASAGFAYTQVLWQTLKAREVSIGGIDAMFGVTTNAWAFLSLELWRKGISLVVLAAITLALPIVAVFTPGTLTVEPSTKLNLTTYFVPLPTLNYTVAETYAQNTQGSELSYAAPSNEISRLVSSVSSQGDVLPIPPLYPQYPQSAYTLSFYGPSLSCKPMGGRPEFQAQFDKIYKNITGGGSGQGGEFVNYIGIIPQARPGAPLPPGATSQQEASVLLGLQYCLNNTLIGSALTVDKYSPASNETDYARFFISLPNLQSAANTTIECGLFNASYHVDFNFRNTTQSIEVKNVTRLNGVNKGMSINYPQKPDVFAALSVMDALGSILIGKLTSSHYNFNNPTRTQILSTVLMQTTEMKNLNKNGNWATLPEDTLRISGPGSLSRTLEQLVANMTLSLFSDKHFLNNTGNSTKGDVNVWSSQNKYTYTPRNLLIAYGTGVFTTVVVVAIGLGCIFLSADTYSATFSTMLRTTRNRELDQLVKREETVGAEPLPKYLSKTKLRFRYGLGGVEALRGGAFIVAKRSGFGKDGGVESGSVGEGGRGYI